MGMVLVGVAQEPSWPAIYHGWLLRIEQLSDGRYVGFVRGQYQSPPSLTRQDALADITAWCDAQVMRVGRGS